MSRARRRPIAEINVVPYIDVMLVLLIIFMVTAPLLSQGVEIDLPSSDAKPLDSDSPSPAVLSIKADGSMYLNIADDIDQALGDAEVISLLQQSKTQQPDRAIMIRGDRNAPYDFVMQALVLLQQSDIEDVGLITDPAEETP